MNRVPFVQWFYVFEKRIKKVVLWGKSNPQAVWSFLYFYFLLTSYYLLRPVRDAMGASADANAVFPSSMVSWAMQHGFDLADFTLQVLFLGVFIAMLFLQPVYGWLVSRFPRHIFLPSVYVVFSLCLLGFYMAFQHEVSGRGAVFFIWVAVFNLFAVSIFWSFMADIFNNTEAKRLFGYIGVGGTLGAITGPTLTKLFVVELGVANMLLISMACLMLCLLCISRLSAWVNRTENNRPQQSDESMGGSVWQGLRLIATTPMMRLLALLMFFGVGVGTLLYNEQAAIAKRFFTEDAARTQFFSGIDLAINVLTLLIQLFLTKPILSKFGISPALLIPAFAVVLGYAVLAMSPLPLWLAMVQIASRAGEFSLAKPARESIYTRVDRQSRYKAKAAIDTLVYRGGDLSFAWVYKGVTAFGSSAVFVTGFVVAIAMSLTAWRVIQTDKHMPDS